MYFMNLSWYQQALVFLQQQQPEKRPVSLFLCEGERGMWEREKARERESKQNKGRGRKNWKESIR
jgi:hypothetical protein